MTVPTQYALVVDASALRVMVALNGIAIFDRTDRRRVTSTSKITGWLVPGSNRMDVRLEALPRSSEPIPTPGTSKCTLVVRTFVSGVGAEGTTDLARLQFDNATQTLPLVHALSFAGDGVPVWGWAASRPIELSASDHRAVHEILARLIAALQARDLDQATTLLAPMFREQATALGVSEQELKRVYVEFVGGRSRPADWQVLPLDPARTHLIPMAGGRLFKAVRQDGGEMIQGRSSAGSFSFQPYLSRIEGAWSIVR